jgi:hypothetical protein
MERMIGSQRRKNGAIIPTHYVRKAALLENKTIHGQIPSREFLAVTQFVFFYLILKGGINTKELLLELVDVQKNTSPILLQIGYLSSGNHVEHNAILIREAAPAVLKAIMGFSDKIMCSVQEDGVLVTWLP